MDSALDSWATRDTAIRATELHHFTAVVSTLAAMATKAMAVQCTAVASVTMVMATTAMVIMATAMRVTTHTEAAATETATVLHSLLALVLALAVVLAIIKATAIRATVIQTKACMDHSTAIRVVFMVLSMAKVDTARVPHGWAEPF